MKIKAKIGKQQRPKIPVNTIVTIVVKLRFLLESAEALFTETAVGENVGASAMI